MNAVKFVRLNLGALGSGWGRPKPEPLDPKPYIVQLFVHAEVSRNWRPFLGSPNGISFSMLRFRVYGFALLLLEPVHVSPPRGMYIYIMEKNREAIFYCVEFA